MGFLGGILGFFIATVLYVITVIFLGGTVLLFGPIATLPQIAPLITLLFGLLTFWAWVVVAVFTVVIVTVFAYALATIGLLPLIAAAIAGPATPAPPPPVAPLPNSLLENFMRGLIIGLTAGINLGIYLLVLPFVLPPPVGIAVGLTLSLIGFLAVFPFISGNIVYQGILGWTTWVRPMAHLATAIGILLFFLNLPSAIAAAIVAGAPFPVRFDVLTATFETAGGAVIGITGFAGGFNLGNFTFLTVAPSAFNGVNPIPGGGGAVGLIGGISSHETGHTLNAGAFGGVFHWINAIDENLGPFARNTLAYGELTAESHFQRGGTGLGVGTAATAPTIPRQHVGIW